MSGVLVRLALTALLLALLVGCGRAYRGAPLHGPLEPTTAEIELGQRVYHRYCHECHPGGASGLAPGTNNIPAPGWLIKFQVRAGLGAMPSFGGDQISGEELDALVKYMAELKKHGSPGGD